MRLLYCVFSAAGRKPPAPPSMRGVDGQPIALVPQGRLRAGVSPLGENELGATLARVEAYERVVEAFFRERTIVPMRFGSILESDAAVARYLSKHGARFRARLRELSGCVEMGVRLAAPAGVEASRPPRDSRALRARRREAAPGRAYLEARVERRRAAEELAERYRDGLSGLFSRFEVEAPSPAALVVGPEGMAALSLSFLVPSSCVEAFRKAFGEVHRGEGSARLSGPWPPYSFVTDLEGGSERRGQ